MIRRILQVGLFALAVALCAVAAFIAAPLPKGLVDYRPVSSVRVLDRNGGLLREIKSSADGRSTPLKSEEIPNPVRDAFLAAEDHRFFRHLGVSPTALVRAAWQDVRAGKIVAGGSTISMQLARTLVPRERSFLGKANEALWAMRLEAHLTKDEILTQYLNRVPFGNNTFGLEAASQLYFARRTPHLSLGQAAALAALPRGPSAYNPYRRPEALENRRQWVLSRMRLTGLASHDAVEEARVTALDLSAFEGTFRAPHFVEYVVSRLPAWGLGEATVVKTSLDPQLQPQVEGMIHEELARLTDRRVGSAAAVVVDNESGEILAYQGSIDFFDEAAGGQNDGIQMRRQPGSALKPFVYAQAFAQGFTPATVIADLETHFLAQKGTWSPKNYDRKTHGPVRAREALANSYNVPAVKVAEAVGAAPLLTLLRRAGFESLGESAEHYGLGLVLGNGEVSLWEAARAYRGLAQGGVVRPLRPVLQAWRADGSELTVTRELKPRRFAQSQAVALVTHVLQDNAARARAFGLDNALRLPFPTAAKTGTSKGYSDNWTVGFTHERTVAVWAGNFDGSPMVRVSGITGAGPIFRRVMTGAMAGLTPAPLVDERGLTTAQICPLSGRLAGRHCPAKMDEHFAIGTEPASGCQMHGASSLQLPPELATRCLQLEARQGRLVDLGVDYYDWAQAQGLADEPWLAAACRGGSSDSAEPRILFPGNGDEFVLLADLPLGDQAIPVRVRATPGVGSLELRVDGQLAQTLTAPFTTRIPALRGAHTLSVHKPGDERALGEVKFQVRAESAL
jgi:penicillin-binding protein 1C